MFKWFCCSCGLSPSPPLFSPSPSSLFPHFGDGNHPLAVEFKVCFTAFFLLQIAVSMKTFLLLVIVTGYQYFVSASVFPNTPFFSIYVLKIYEKNWWSKMSSHNTKIHWLKSKLLLSTGLEIQYFFKWCSVHEECFHGALQHATECSPKYLLQLLSNRVVQLPLQVWLERVLLGTINDSSVMQTA